MVRLDFVLADLQRDLAILERYRLDNETGNETDRLTVFLETFSFEIYTFPKPLQCAS